MDEATLELRRKIDEMLLASGRSEETTGNAFGKSEASAGTDGGHGLLGAFHMDDFTVKGPPVRDEKEDIQAEVRSIIKSCLQVEDAAQEIKRGKPLAKHQKLYAEVKPTGLGQSFKPPSAASQTMKR